MDPATKADVLAHLRQRQEHFQRAADAANNTASMWGWLTTGAQAASVVADTAMGVLPKVAFGPGSPQARAVDHAYTTVTSAAGSIAAGEGATRVVGKVLQDNVAAVAASAAIPSVPKDASTGRIVAAGLGDETIEAGIKNLLP